MTPEERKLQTEKLLRDRNIPYLDSLPPTEPEDEVVLRDIEEVRRRIVCLFCYVGTAFEQGETRFIEYLDRYEYRQYLAPSESNYLAAPSYSTQANIDATWKYEALYLLCWSVGIVPSLEVPLDQSPTKPVVEAFPTHDEPPTQFLSKLSIRTKSQVMDASDLIYRLHWATRQYGPKIEIVGGVVQEWHQAINWLTNYDGEDWDWVATDT